MAANQANKFSDKVKESLETAQARLAVLEEEAHKVVAASRKEVANLLHKINAQEIFDKDYMREWSGKAKTVGGEVAQRFDSLRERVVTFAGIATREQVEELARDLDKLARKLDRALGPTAAAKKPARAKDGVEKEQKKA